MENKGLSLLVAASTVLLSIPQSSMAAAEMPVDTYFSLAVADNSHNHYGDNLLFLDFQDPLVGGERHPRTVVAPRVGNSSIVMDGKADDWDTALMTRVDSRVMNNYPLSEHYDATPTDLNVGAAFDDQYIYFLVQYEDASKSASMDRNRWVYDGKQWVPQDISRPAPGTAASKAVNLEDDLAGNEDEDQVFMMFPIVDQQSNFADGALGCAGYCHANLSISPDPTKAQIGDGVASMHTAMPGDVADLWQWTATRSRPMNTLKDGYLDYGDSSYNGRKTDEGTDPFEDNAGTGPYRPLYVHKGDYEAGKYDVEGYATPSLTKSDLLPIMPDMKFAKGVSLPFYIGVPATGSRADVSTAATFDQESGVWTIEFRRALNTGNKFDRQFLDGVAAQPPSTPAVIPGDPEKGKQLFVDKACASCHGEKGEGTYRDGYWVYPRNQRASGPAIRKTARPQRPERLHSLAHELKRYDEAPPKAMMPYVPLSAQEAEDIGAWLQQQFIPRGN